MLNTQKKHGRKPYTQEEKELHKKQAERLKAEFKLHGITNRAEMAEQLFVSETQVSNYLAGKYDIGADRLKEIATRWLYRPEYLLCEDDFKTFDAMLEAVHETKYSKHKTAVDYLISLGFSIVPGVYRQVHNSVIRNNIDIFRMFYAYEFTADALKALDELRKLPTDERKEDWYYFRLRSCEELEAWQDSTENLEEWSGEDAPHFKFENCYVVTKDKVFAFPPMSVKLLYHVQTDNCDMGYFSNAQIKELIKQIDNVVKGCVPGLLELIAEK